MRYGVHQQYKGRKTGPGGRERVKDGQGRKTDDRKTGRGQMDRMVDRKTNDGQTRQTSGVHMVDGRTYLGGNQVTDRQEQGNETGGRGGKVAEKGHGVSDRVGRRFGKGHGARGSGGKGSVIGHVDWFRGGRGTGRGGATGGEPQGRGVQTTVLAKGKAPAPERGS